MIRRTSKESALNLTLKGSTGSFNLGTPTESEKSIEVKYLLTHVSLNFSNSSDEGLLNHLLPVREIFDINQLDFDEIMQRDIDDARVSSELIPYLLDENLSGLVKLFPPIIIVVLPIKDNENRPDNLYPQVTIEDIEVEGHPTRILRSGTVGREVFQFEQPIEEEEVLNHDYVRLKLNTHKTRLVIVDGQHRAMALLALYRNLKDQWSDERRLPFKDYYSEWTPKYIQQFNLQEVNLPVMLCTFPSLEYGKYKGDFDIKKAARSVFLTLNKTARKVSDSRNTLLGDNDLIAYFLRQCLSEIKQKDRNSSYSLRINNIELDQEGDNINIHNPIAITGVNHLNYIIQFLLLAESSQVEGIVLKKAKISNREDLNKYPFMERLDGRNLLGADMANATRRKSFTKETAAKLGHSFDDRYGRYIIYAFENFSLYENHNKAVLKLEQVVDENENRKIKPILFEGQGISRVFESHRKNLKRKVETSQAKTPQIEEIVQRLDATKNRVDEVIKNFRKDRTELCLQSMNGKEQLKKDNIYISEVVTWFNGFYDNVLTSVAFQTALICGFFWELEKANTDLEKNGKQKIDIDDCFGEYISQLNDYFIPNTFPKLKKLIQVFDGELDYQKDSYWRIIPRNETFREVVFRGTMEPKQWIKYKYLLLEIWQPTHETLKRLRYKELEICRGQIFSDLYLKNEIDYCKKQIQIKSLEDLSEDEKTEIFEHTFLNYKGFLKALNADLLDKNKMKDAVKLPSPSAIDNDYTDEED